MENQIDVGDQNTQQIGQNTINQSLPNSSNQKIQSNTQAVNLTVNMPKSSKLKWLIIVLILIPILLVLLLFVITTPGVKKLSECLNDANLAIERNVQTATIERWNKKKVCINGKTVAQNLKSCYFKTENESSIPFGLIESLAKLIKPNVLTLEKAINMHNTACSDYPELLIVNP